MTTALVNGQPATWLEVTIPWSGIPLVRCKAPDDVTPVAGRVAFTLGDLLLSTTLIPERFGMFAGSWEGEAVAGAGGWKTTLPPKGYRSPAGLLNVPILADAAAAAGELPPVVQAPRAVGGFYVRSAGPASDVFNPTVIGSADWWVSPEGIAQVGTRAPGLVTAEFDLLDVQRKAGRVVVATESPAAFVPGMTFVDPLEGEFTINACVWTADAGKLRGELWTA